MRKRTGVLYAWLFVCGITLFGTHDGVRAQDGSLDSTFGGDGRVTFDIVAGQEDMARGVVVQEDGKTVLAGDTCDSLTCPTTGEDLVFVRLNQDGSLDPSFGNAGVSVINLDLGGFNQDILESPPVILPTGEIVFAATVSVGVEFRPTLGRLLPNGLIDPSFGIGGIALVESISGFGRSMVRQTDGKLLITGDAYAANGSTDVYVARFTASGVPDATFATNGVFLSDLDLGNDPGQLSEWAVGITSDPSNRVLVTGGGQYAAQDWDGFVLRLTPGGLPDPSFGTDGLAWLFLDLGGNNYDELTTISTDQQARIVVAGNASSGLHSSESVVVRLTSTGNLDPTFGISGLARIDLDPRETDLEHLSQVWVDTFGRILVIGSSADPSGNIDCRAVRLSREGVPDPAFGTNGIATVSFDLSAPPNDGDQCFSLALQEDGRVVVAGAASRSTSSGREFEFAAGRLLSSSAIFWDGFESGDTTAW